MQRYVSCYLFWADEVFSCSGNEVGNTVSASLPNVTGTSAMIVTGQGNKMYGALYEGSNGVGYFGGGEGTGNRQWLDASRSSSVYKDSATTVVPESLKTGFYIKF